MLLSGKLTGVALVLLAGAAMRLAHAQTCDVPSYNCDSECNQGNAAGCGSGGKPYEIVLISPTILSGELTDAHLQDTAFKVPADMNRALREREPTSRVAVSSGVELF